MAKAAEGLAGKCLFGGAPLAGCCDRVESASITVATLRWASSETAGTKIHAANGCPFFTIRLSKLKKEWNA
ncbi:hypothetical protein JI58_03165 [Marinosulfonomonas sp. PRT-SC04]|nr:hypothetical protein JI58_03165 [Marinosulfonomonas sp. PRT-SC04]